MIQHSIDRSRSTGGGMGASLVLHATVLLLLSLLAGRQAIQQNTAPELTEISYLETLPGEDVTTKVKEEVGSTKVEKPELPGTGIETRSAMKPQEAPAPAPAPKVETPAPVKAELPQVPEPVRRSEPKADIAAVAAPAPSAKKPMAQVPEAKMLAQATPRPASRRISAPDAATRAATQVVAEGATLVSAPRQTSTQTFQPKEAGLKRRTGTIAAGADVIAADTGGRREAGLAEASATLAAGGLQGRENRKQSTFAMAGASLQSSRGRGGGGVADVAGPATASTGRGGSGKGRRTILDYGSGGGGRGGALKGKGRLAEPTATPVEAAPATDSSAGQQVAEAGMDKLDGNMTITGQIQGRQILRSVPAEYSDQARRKGWEGVVAVHFTVLADGRVKDNMYFEQTSVHRDLNQAAMAAIRKFRFAPLPADQAAVEQWGVITIVFRLN
ncbi:hypothetical protein CSB20_05790 [bacterium DOLZORAL124_64_63]|nr:MAG: hypothetical protein CSB20_05790 [bacterium DOLZORAL124_64_63]